MTVTSTPRCLARNGPDLSATSHRVAPPSAAASAAAAAGAVGAEGGEDNGGSRRLSVVYELRSPSFTQAEVWRDNAHWAAQQRLARKRDLQRQRQRRTQGGESTTGT
jgi:hypothetical protein